MKLEQVDRESFLSLMEFQLFLTTTFHHSSGKPELPARLTLRSLVLYETGEFRARPSL
uniref:Uncharacterized protein n=1 Tax=Utricularia reniformis TaxID=192314 RepID=A0A1Y0AYU7_9LAMI|nr:hypothetical protein AEK19_MT0966 [Utricularia reniformis]ART30336.1 hypothetical protein AEK19_MT0966 [Utricularia reniformis]